MATRKGRRSADTSIYVPHRAPAVTPSWITKSSSPKSAPPPMAPRASHALLDTLTSPTALAAVLGNDHASHKKAVHASCVMGSSACCMHRARLRVRHGELFHVGTPSPHEVALASDRASFSQAMRPKTSKKNSAATRCFRTVASFRVSAASAAAPKARHELLTLLAHGLGPATPTHHMAWSPSRTGRVSFCVRDKSPREIGHPGNPTQRTPPTTTVALWGS